jgi:hypothetical protein
LVRGKAISMRGTLPGFSEFRDFDPPGLKRLVERNVVKAVTARPAQVEDSA